VAVGDTPAANLLALSGPPVEWRFSRIVPAGKGCLLKTPRLKKSFYCGHDELINTEKGVAIRITAYPSLNCTKPLSRLNKYHCIARIYLALFLDLWQEKGFKGLVRRLYPVTRI